MGKDGVPDQLTEILALIETERQEIERTAGRLASCAISLHKLRILLDDERKALHLRDFAADPAQGVDAVNVEIARVTRLSMRTG